MLLRCVIYITYIRHIHYVTDANFKLLRYKDKILLSIPNPAVSLTLTFGLTSGGGGGVGEGGGSLLGVAHLVGGPVLGEGDEDCPPASPTGELGRDPPLPSMSAKPRTCMGTRELLSLRRRRLWQRGWHADRPATRTLMHTHIQDIIQERVILHQSPFPRKR